MKSAYSLGFREKSGRGPRDLVRRSGNQVKNVVLVVVLGCVMNLGKCLAQGYITNGVLDVDTAVAEAYDVNWAWFFRGMGCGFVYGGFAMALRFVRQVGKASGGEI
jgi:hypothetical protein